jgi:hypothetical protein
MKIIQFKDNVRIKRWTPAIATILDNAEVLMNRYSWIPELVITSCNDSNHAVNSRHYKDEALDIRSKNFNTIEDKVMFKNALQEELGGKFTVLLESLGTDNEHFHVQVKKDETYP